MSQTVIAVGTSVSKLNKTVKHCEEIERCYAPCEHLSRWQKSLKYSLVEKLESAVAAWLGQSCAMNASIDDNHLYEKAFQIMFCLEVNSFFHLQWLQPTFFFVLHHFLFHDFTLS
jgi:hypothetical protein